MKKPVTLAEHRAAGHTVTRYVATYVNRDGMRTLMTSAQGRHTYATAAEAQGWIDAVARVNHAGTLSVIYGDDPRFEVRPCECWAGHFDPVGVYFPGVTIDALRRELKDAHQGEGGRASALSFRAWLEAAAGDDRHALQDAARELLAIEAAR